MKTINLVCGSFSPERTAGANRALILSKVLSEKFKVNVIYLTKPSEVFNINQLPLSLQQNENISLYPVYIDKFSKSNFLKRTLTEIRHALLLMNKCKMISADTQIISIPFLMLLPISAMYFIGKSKENRILEIRDIIWKYFEFKEGFLNKVIYHILTYICQLSLKAFDQIVTVTESQKTEIQKVFSREVTCIGNGLDKGTFDKLSEIGGTPKAQSINISYVGSIGYPQNLSILVDTADKLQHKNIHIHIFGDGPSKKELEDKVLMLKLSNITFYGSVDFEHLKEGYINSHILYAQLRDIPSLKTAEPTKIFEYAATGRKIIFGIKGDGEKLLGNFENVSIIKPDNIDALASEIEKLVECNDFGVSQFNINKVNSSYLRESITSKYFSVI
jgi:glycosyltransferase involved in cell wall biosynthesis